MSKRFSGAHSPRAAGVGKPVSTSKTPGRAKVRARGLITASILFAAPLPLLFRVFGGGAGGMLKHLSALVLLWLGVWLIREGTRARAAFQSRTTAGRPIPRIVPGALLLGTGVALTTLAQAGPIGAGIYAAITVFLALVAFGLDPLADKGAPDVSAGDRRRVVEAVAEGEAMLTQMEQAADAAGLRDVRDRVHGFTNAARSMFRQIEEDPRDLTRARRFMGIYLQGARDAAVKFAALWQKDADEDAKSAFVALLDQLETRFNAKQQELLRDDRADLDVEIEVLQDFLKREAG